MFGPESTATGRFVTSVDSRSPVAGSRPFVRLRIGQRAGKRRDGLAERGARNRDDGEVRLGDRRLGDRRRGDPVEIDVREVARVPPGRRDRRACSGSRQASVTSWPWSRRTTANAVPHEPPPTTTSHAHSAYSLLTKSIETGTPSSSNRLRSSFSTQ